VEAAVSAAPAAGWQPARARRVISSGVAAKCRRSRPCLEINRGSACPNESSATVGDGLAEVCQRSVPSYDDGAIEGAGAVAGRKVYRSLHSEAAYGVGVLTCAARNGIHFRNVTIRKVNNRRPPS
jgi:hypothetical protein